jgi:hypothetical protein
MIVWPHKDLVIPDSCAGRCYASAMTIAGLSRQYVQICTPPDKGFGWWKVVDFFCRYRSGEDALSEHPLIFI